MLLEGRVTAKDEKSALRLLLNAADQGNADALYQLGGCYYLGRGVTRDLSKAAACLRRAVDQGHPNAKVMLGAIYLEKDYVEANDEQGLRLLREAADAENILAAIDLGIIYEDGSNGAPQDYDQAIKYFHQAAKQGDAEAQYRLARICHFGGKGVKRNDATALSWLRLAANQNHR